MSKTDATNEDATKISEIEINSSDRIEASSVIAESIPDQERAEEVDSKEINDFLKSSWVEPKEISDVFDVPFPFTYERPDESKTP